VDELHCEVRYFSLETQIFRICFAFRNINTVGTTEIYACGDMSEVTHSAQEAHESLVRG
jgi:hypothetical protein